MAYLFQLKVPTINELLKTLYADGEIQPETTIVRQEGGRQVRRNIDHYNLDAILAVGYRVASDALPLPPCGSAILESCEGEGGKRTLKAEEWPSVSDMYQSRRKILSA